ncbi:hypothetical protein EDD86DRAFT_220138 [Gorgonomyces haynaldii]|nr:hypothetical protein EDD86DRAFT_220138 [Gorgonomyces haynaldii]
MDGSMIQMVSVHTFHPFLETERFQSTAKSEFIRQSKPMVGCGSGHPLNSQMKIHPSTFHGRDVIWNRFLVTLTWILALFLTLDHSLLVENFLDPAHLPFTHDTTIGKRSDATPMTIDCQFSKDGIKGVSSTLERPDMVITVFEFRPPVNVSIKFVFPNKPTKMDQSFYCVPTKKGHCRFVWLQRFSFISPWLLQIPVLGSYIRSKMEAYNRKVVMEDYKMLKGQQERLSAGANAMNAPVQADLMVKTYRNWWRLSKKTGFWFKGYSTDIEDIVLS